VSSILTGGSAATSLPADERFGDAGVAQWPAATSLQADERFGDAGVAQWPAATSLQADERFGDAGVAQLVEHQLPKLRVAGSSPVSRFAVEEQDRPRADAEARAGLRQERGASAVQTPEGRVRWQSRQRLDGGNAPWCNWQHV
jgi:hypothetical protein